MSSWQSKVNDRIYALCRVSWLQNGKRQGYSVPLEAEALVEALGRDDEETCKAILMYGLIGDPSTKGQQQ